MCFCVDVYGCGCRCVFTLMCMGVAVGVFCVDMYGCGCRCVLHQRVWECRYGLLFCVSMYVWVDGCVSLQCTNLFRRDTCTFPPQPLSLPFVQVEQEQTSKIVMALPQI